MKRKKILTNKSKKRKQGRKAYAEKKREERLRKQINGSYWKGGFELKDICV